MARPSPDCVFINCPFDPKYLTELFRPLVFTVLSLGFTPRCALERADSGEVRVIKILQLIGESQFAIHDLSRCRAAKTKEFYRMNMPLELGFDLGAKQFGGKHFAAKQILILEKDRHSVKVAASDLAGCDCAAHDDDQLTIVTCVRDWLVQAAGAPKTGANAIFNAYLVFMASLTEDLTARQWSAKHIDGMQVNELIENMSDWLESNPY